MDRITEYFNAFELKDINYFYDIFSEKAQLNDWDVSKSGKYNILNHYKLIFANLKNINITLIETYSINDTDIILLKLKADGVDEIKIADFITYENSKIIKIEAFKM